MTLAVTHSLPKDDSIVFIKVCTKYFFVKIPSRISNSGWFNDVCITGARWYGNCVRLYVEEYVYTIILPPPDIRHSNVLNRIGVTEFLR